VDKFGGATMKPAILAKWRGRGVRMATFCAYSKWRERWRLNFEITLAVCGPSFVASVGKMLENDFSHSEEVGRSDCESRPLLFKAGARAARLLAPIL
jgi:cardiolipin synthase